MDWIPYLSIFTDESSLKESQQELNEIISPCMRSPLLISPSVASHKNFACIMHKYQLKTCIGKGSFGTVYEGIEKSSGKKVAIKHIKRVFQDIVYAQRIYREIFILRQMDSPHIISLYDVICPAIENNFNWASSYNSNKASSHKGSDMFMVFPYLDTDLEKIFQDDQFLQSQHIKVVMYQLLKALKFIHSANVIHRDIKPANILVNVKDSTVQLVDFGLARVVDASLIPDHVDSIWDATHTSSNDDDNHEDDDHDDVDEDHNFHTTSHTDKNDDIHDVDDDIYMHVNKKLSRCLTQHVITRWYRAPEVILSQPYNAAVDIWSIGCIFAELFQMQHENQPDYMKRKAIFPGGNSYNGYSLDLDLSSSPASIESISDDDVSCMLGGENGQLMTIFQVLGTPSIHDMDGYDHKIMTTLLQLPHRDAMSLQKRYPAADPVGINLLQEMLQFNPKNRISVNSALSHPYFQFMREYSQERVAWEALQLEPKIDDIEQVVELIRAEVNHYLEK